MVVVAGGGEINPTPGQSNGAPLAMTLSTLVPGEPGRLRRALRPAPILICIMFGRFDDGYSVVTPKRPRGHLLDPPNGMESPVSPSAFEAGFGPSSPPFAR